jgi:putative FmdB family regulatory protein
MPLYEYQCDACGHRFETIQKFSDPPIEQCSKCGAAVRKLQSAPAFQFKGTGWYITDYAKKDSVPAGTTGESAPASAPASKDAAPASAEKSGSGDSTAPSTPTPAATKTTT